MLNYKLLPKFPGVLKISLRLTIFGWLMYRRTRISRNVLLANVGVADAWPIFLIATLKSTIKLNSLLFTSYFLFFHSFNFIFWFPSYSYASVQLRNGHFSNSVLPIPSPAPFPACRKKSKKENCITASKNRTNEIT